LARPRAVVVTSSISLTPALAVRGSFISLLLLSRYVLAHNGDPASPPRSARVSR